MSRPASSKRVVPTPRSPHQQGLAEINALAQNGRRYAVVHMYFVPGDRNDRNRHMLRREIEHELRTIEPRTVRLHRDAFAVPLADELSAAETASRVWECLLIAGASTNTDRHAWQRGDAIYVHYPADGELTSEGVVIDRPGQPFAPPS
jgi:hypothetical protein